MAIGVDVDGVKHILGLWIAKEEGATHFYFTTNSAADAPLHMPFHCTIGLPPHKNTALILRFSLN